MATKFAHKKQARAIKKLRDLGIIKKVDLRNKPSPAVKRALRKYADVISRRAAVVRPKKPGTFKKLFRVVNGRVIVPRRKGEKISVTKSGKIQSVRKVGKRTVRSIYRHVPRPGETKIVRRPRVVFALPVQRGGTVEWYRWKSYDAMIIDMQSGSLMGYKNFQNYVVEETVMPGERLIPEHGSETEDERNANLDGIMETRLRGRREQREAFIGSQAGY